MLICCASVAHAEYHFTATLEGFYFDYREADEIGTLNDETGWIPGLSLEMNNLKQGKPGTVSNGTTVLTVKEPESRANHISISLGYVYSF